MGLVNAVYSWVSVKALHATVFSMNVAGIVALIFSIVWAVRFEKGFGDYLNLITPGNGHIWTTVIILASLLCCPAYFLGVKSYLYLKLLSMKHDLDHERTNLDHDVNRLLFFHAVACLASGLLVTVLNATYLVWLSNFQQKTRDGLIEAIEKYGNDVVSKARVDAVQTELECCGDSNYEDWFRVPWLRVSVEESETKSPLEGQSATKDDEDDAASVDVPFSCCSNDIPKLCVHHDILKPSPVYDYDPKHLTITKFGCRLKIIARGVTIRFYLAGYLALLSVYQVVLSFLCRLLQTAHSNEMYIGPHKSRYNVWIFHKPSTYADDILLQQRKIVDIRRRRSRETLASSSTSTTSDEDTSVANQENETKKNKLLQSVRSKIASVKSKSLPAIKSSAIVSSKSRNKNLHWSDTEEEELHRQEIINTPKRESFMYSRSDTRKPSNRILNISEKSIEHLPPPPPPPPFILNLETQSEEESLHPSIKQSSQISLIVDLKDDKKLIGENPGRRNKVLEKFGKIWQREHGGAESGNNSPETTPRSNRFRREMSQDTYDRFRGTLQHTLARREIQAVKRKLRIYSPRCKNMDTRRSNLINRLRNNVPPSYKLLANIEVPRRLDRTPRPPPPPPPPLPPNTWMNSPIRKKPSRRKCSVCRRPVRCIDPDETMYQRTPF